MMLTVIIVSEQEPMNPSGRLCQVIGPRGPIVMTFVVNPALFQTDCACFSLVPMKLGTSHWFGVGVGVRVGVTNGSGTGLAWGSVWE